MKVFERRAISVLCLIRSAGSNEVRAWNTRLWRASLVGN